MSRIISDLLDHGCTEADVTRLLSQWGGLPLFVPRQPGPAHPLVVVAGAQVAGVLAQMYGGERVFMPLGRSFRRELQRREIFALKRSGMNHVQIARRLGLHLRLVQRIVVHGEPAAPAGPVAAPVDERQLQLALDEPEAAG